MAAGGRIPSYQEQYVETSWPVRASECQDEAPQDYCDTAVVPVDGDDMYSHIYCDNEKQQQSVIVACDPESDPTVHLNQPVGPGDYTQNNTLYVLEDRVRHMVNVSIEEFRADVQHIFYQEFGHYRQSMMTGDEAATTRNDQSMVGLCEDVKLHSHDALCTNQASSVSGEETGLNECVIKLLTYAAVITSTLQRQEYAVK